MIDQFPKLLLFKYCSVIGYFLNQIHRPDSFFSISKLIPNLCFFFVINTKYHDSVVAEAREVVVVNFITFGQTVY